MELAKVLPKGQITIPAAIRKKLDLKEGDKILFIEDGEGFRMFKASTRNLHGEGGAHVEKA
ncbi:MAG: AbrB/MazE/SpoVT family DNA-binding domain-containing protein [Desulfovibrio sp.]|jgi:AbrB family looped-hinge helix DNA binding protein|nr:AbrB/MazE/SpoVT family DNA-binding domain-containing protein [Desulfovibrio sp.]